MVDITLIYGTDLPVKSALIAWTQFLELTGVHSTVVGELIELGWLSPQQTRDEQYLFRSRDEYRVRKLDRLCADLDISLTGGSIIVDLLERIDTLEKRVRDLERLV